MSELDTYRDCMIYGIYLIYKCIYPKRNLKCDVNMLSEWKYCTPAFVFACEHVFWSHDIADGMPYILVSSFIRRHSLVCFRSSSCSRDKTPLHVASIEIM